MQHSQEHWPRVCGAHRRELRLGDRARVRVSDRFQDREDFVLDGLLELVVRVETVVEPLEDEDKVFLHGAFQRRRGETMFHVQLEAVLEEVLEDLLGDFGAVGAVFEGTGVTLDYCAGGGGEEAVAHLGEGAAGGGATHDGGAALGGGGLLGGGGGVGFAGGVGGAVTFNGAEGVGGGGFGGAVEGGAGAGAEEAGGEGHAGGGGGGAGV